MKNQRCCAEMRRSHEACSNCRGDLAEKANAPVNVSAGRDHGLANIGSDAKEIGAARARRNNNLGVTRFPQQDIELRAKTLNPHSNTVGLDALTGPANEPRARRVKPRDPA